MSAPVEAVQLAPGRWALPRLPESDPAALHRLAADCRELSAVLAAAVRDADWVVADVRREWTGRAAMSAPEPLRRLDEDVVVVRRALAVLADELDRLADALARAEQSHAWSWHKVALVSAVVAVTAGAVIVTVGSAGTATAGTAAAETAVVSAAAGEMAAASAAAASAETAAVEGLLLAARIARAVETMRAIVVPRLVLTWARAQVWADTPLGAAAIAGGTTAATEYVDDRHVDPVDVAFSALLGAGESYVNAPGRGNSVELTDQRLARLDKLGRRRDLLRARSAALQDRVRARYIERRVQSHFDHAKVFGIHGSYSPENAVRYQRAIDAFIDRPGTVRIDGLYKGEPAIFFTDYDSRRIVVLDVDGTFRTGFKLSPKQAWHVWHDGRLGGG